MQVEFPKTLDRNRDKEKGAETDRKWMRVKTDLGEWTKAELTYLCLKRKEGRTSWIDREGDRF
jgi:hypothetical protein